MKKMATASLKTFRDRFKLPIKDEDLESLPYLRFPEDSPEHQYMKERRAALGGFLAHRRRSVEPLGATSSPVR